MQGADITTASCLPSTPDPGPMDTNQTPRRIEMRAIPYRSLDIDWNQPERNRGRPVQPAASIRSTRFRSRWPCQALRLPAALGQSHDNKRIFGGPACAVGAREQHRAPWAKNKGARGWGSARTGRGPHRYPQRLPLPPCPLRRVVIVAKPAGRIRDAAGRGDRRRCTKSATLTLPC